MTVRFHGRLALLAALSVFVSPARGADVVLAVSAAHKATVSATGGSGWCGSAVALRMVLQPDSPDIGNDAAQSALLNRLGPVIGRNCPQAESADVRVASDGRVLGSFAGRADGGWRFSASSLSGEAAQARREPIDQPPVEAIARPAERDYSGALLAFLQQKPALAGDTQVLSYWAATKHPRAFQQANGQEFRLQPLLELARSELDRAIAAAPVGLLTFTMQVQFGAYDFAQQRFPFLQPIGGVVMNRPCCTFSDPLPGAFQISISDSASLAGLPMAPGAARQFLETRTNRFGNVDRQLQLVVTVQLAPGSFGNDQGNPQGTGELRQVIMLGTQPPQAEVTRLDARQLAALRLAGAAKAAAAASDAARAASAQQAALARQQADQQRQMLQGQRATLIAELTNAPLSVRLANYITDGPAVSTFTHLDNLRDLRADAVVSGRPVQAALLVHADSSGRRDVSTSWPGSLLIEIPATLPRLASGGWYLVRGALSVPPGDDAPPAVLAARAIAPCQQQNCADLAEPQAILARKLDGGAPDQP